MRGSPQGLPFFCGCPMVSRLSMVAPLRHRRFDLMLVAWFVVFAFTSLVMEMYITFRVDLASATDPFGRVWFWYANSFDPVFLDPPYFLWLMCTLDGFVFGPFYLVLIAAFVRGWNWIRLPAIIYVSAIVYSTAIYFGVEFAEEAHRADLPMVLLINIPYTIVPIVLLGRVWRPDVFATGAAE